jgi:hypothetical protein
MLFKKGPWKLEIREVSKTVSEGFVSVPYRTEMCVSLLELYD